MLLNDKLQCSNVVYAVGILWFRSGEIVFFCSLYVFKLYVLNAFQRKTEPIILSASIQFCSI